MRNEKMTLTRALAEKKLLAKRIDKATSKAHLVDYKIGINSKPHRDVDTVANYTSIMDLIKRRTAISSALILKNAVTPVTIAGEEMTIAEAIAKKEVMMCYRELADRCRYEINILIRKKESVDEDNRARLDTLIQSMFGKDKVDKDLIEAAEKGFNDKNGFIELDALKVRDKIKELDEMIESFELEVDFALSEVNATTSIEINY